MLDPLIATWTATMAQLLPGVLVTGARGGPVRGATRYARVFIRRDDARS